MIARDLQPYEFVENKGFQDLIRDLQPQYKIPHRTTFSRTVIPELYRRTVDSLKTQIASDIAKGLESLAFTTDMWTSRANQGYISLTCHYMTQDFAVKAFTLACCHLQESHTAVNIQACLTEIVKEWSLDLSTVPVYVVTDNGRNIRAAVRQMEWIPLQCLGHTLQLAIKDAKEETPVVSSLCKKARALVGHYKHSAQATRRLKDCQKRMELPSIGLIQDVDTRWNSEHAMLSRLVQLRDAVSLEIATSETSVSCPSPKLSKSEAIDKSCRKQRRPGNRLGDCRTAGVREEPAQ
ncbi:zinc finger BED domain-containing protein 4-like [Rhipicephalus sanguineus]|uniref:zinc finger BED domain-containing protein 4-like n=1 Tax=Rhipicephalus sanguineus TaxID=34632 RepID=UPI001895936F|nr:zinc finger BED domain-containing protein 4-like [Rhipicephalus sanguineus]